LALKRGGRAESSLPPFAIDDCGKLPEGGFRTWQSAPATAEPVRPGNKKAAGISGFLGLAE